MPDNVDGYTALQYTQKACPTCVGVTQLNESLEQELTVLRVRNRILVTVNKALRERLSDLQINTDALILALHEYDQELVKASLDVEVLQSEQGV